MNKTEISHLINTLKLIETRGESTLIMAGCIQYLQAALQRKDVQKDESGGDS